MPDIIMAISAGVGATSTIMQANAQKEARKEALRAQQATQEMEREQNRKAVINTLRQARIKRAMVTQSATNAGATGSGQAGALGSISTQAAGSIGMQGMQQQTAMNVSQFNRRAARAEGQADLFGSIRGLSGDIFNYARDFT